MSGDDRSDHNGNPNGTIVPLLAPQPPRPRALPAHPLEPEYTGALRSKYCLECSVT